MKTYHIFVSGRVQGVFFRANTVREAKKLEIKGWVRNTKDKRVEIIAQGSEKNIKEFLKWLEKGPLLAKVADLKIEEKKLSEKFENFKRK